MLGILTGSEINQLLKTQYVGRLGYRDDKKCYITPVSYAYDGKYIYGQTNEGLKLNILRDYPEVCFEVESIVNMANWKSVVLWGRFDELENDAAKHAREYLYNNLLGLLTSATIHLQKRDHSFEGDDQNRIKQIVYRISIVETAGRFERQ